MLPSTQPIKMNSYEAFYRGKRIPSRLFKAADGAVYFSIGN